MKNLFSFFIFLFILGTNLDAQSVLSPFSYKGVETSRAKRANIGEASSKGYGFFPFNEVNELKIFYDSSSLINSLDKISFLNLVNTEGNNMTSFVEVLSYVDDNSRFKANLNVQLTDTERSDTINSNKNIAIQKLLTSGGNISIGVNRPIYYNEFCKGSMILADLSIKGYFDLPYVNRRVYNPSVGSQISLAGDFRIVTDSKNRGKIFRLGMEYSLVQSLFNSAYQENTDLLIIPSSVGFITVEPYIGLFFFDIKWSFIFSNNSLFDNKKSFVEVSIIPLKF